MGIDRQLSDLVLPDRGPAGSEVNLERSRLVMLFNHQQRAARIAPAYATKHRKHCEWCAVELKFREPTPAR